MFFETELKFVRYHFAVMYNNKVIIQSHFKVKTFSNFFNVSRSPLISSAKPF